MDITCTAFGKRMEVLRDFSPHFLTRHSITRGSTEKDRALENSPFLINSRDKEIRPSHRKPRRAQLCLIFTHLWLTTINYV